MNPLRLRLGANNVYVVMGGAGAVCIDAGPDYDGAWQDVIAQLAAHGLGPGDVRAVILTHAHLDHAGLAWRWRRHGACILAGRGDEPALGRGEDERRTLRELAAALLAGHGVPDEHLRDRAPGRAVSRYTDEEGRWPAPLRMTPIVPDRLLGDGDTVTDGGVSLSIIACPGHTRGTVLVRDERGGGVFTGDHVLPRTVATVGIQFRGRDRWPSMPAFVRSLEGIRDRVSPGTPGWPGHGDRIADMPAAAAWSLRYLERRAERVRRRLAGGPATAYAVAAALFPHLSSAHTWPVMAEIIGLLDWLHERGEVVEEREGGRVVFRAT